MKTATNAMPEPAAPPSARHRRRTLVLLGAIFVVVCVSRAVVFPASIWEQDEAYFAAAVVEIDLDASSPHPPFFPLWIGIGKAAGLVGCAPATGLQTASAVFGSLIFFPLVALWSRIMKPGLAMAATALGLAAPGVWLLSGRAFSGTAATAMLVTALACWTRPIQDRRWLAAGSVAAGLAVLIRPHFVLAVAVVTIVMLARLDRRLRLALVVPAVAVTTAGGAAFVCAAGGTAAVAAALSEHAALHFGALSEAARGLLDSGLARVLGHPIGSVGWCGLALWGAWIVLRSSTKRVAGLPVVAALGSLVILVFGLSNPAHPRYAVPLVILSCGFVVIALSRMLSDRWTLVLVTVAICAAAAMVLPTAAIYRQEASPPLRALAHADRLAAQREGVVVIDRSLHSFVLLREATEATSAPTIFDYVVGLGASPPAPASRTVMVFDDNHQSLLVASESRWTFTCSDELLRRLSQDRFLDVTVADGATLENRSGANGPFVILD